MELYKKVPHSWRFMIRNSNGDIIQQGGFNGRVGWLGADDMDADEAAFLGRVMSLRSALDLEKLAQGAKLVVRTNSGGREIFTFDVPIVAGKRDKLTFDAAIGLLIEEFFAGTTLCYENYQAVGTVKLPFTLRKKNSDGSEQLLKLEKVEHNLPIADSMFERPKSL